MPGQMPGFVRTEIDIGLVNGNIDNNYNYYLCGNNVKQPFCELFITYIVEFNASVNPLALSFNLCATTE